MSDLINSIKTLFSIIFIIILISGCTNTVYQEDKASPKIKEKEKTVQPQDNITAKPTKSVDTTKSISPSEVPPSKVVLDSNCDALPDKLERCEKYKCQFIHPFTKENLVREIFGEENGKCRYVEQMPNGGKMECRYNQDLRKTIVQYYRDTAKSKSFETTVSVDLTTGKSVTRYTIDGKDVENPLQESVASGACVITGYD